jgi:VWFA-related protein
MKKLLVVVAWLAAPAAAAQSQQAPPQGPTFRTGIEVIAVDVAVVDGRGNPVEDLLAPDFAVKIDGAPRRVVSAEHVRIDVEAARRQAADPVETLYTTNLSPPNGRLIIIAVDKAGIRSGGGRPILNAAAKFLDRLSPADRVAFVAYPEPGVAVDFTNDHFVLRRAMERVVGSQQRHQSKFNIGLYEAIAIHEKQDNLVLETVLARECPNMTGLLLEQCGREVLFDIDIAVGNLRKDASDSLRGLRDLLRQLTPVEGSKSLILISEGLILDRPTDLNDIIEAAGIGRVTINVLLMDVPRDDITYSRIRPTVAEDRALQVNGLQDLVASTRGNLYNVIGTADAIFERLASEMSAYYLLAVEQAPSDRDGGRHRIDVEVRRRGVTVRSRRAFVLSSPADTRRKPEEILLEALKAPFGVAEVPLRVTTFTRQDADSAKVRLLLAAEVGQPGAASEEFMVGFALIDNGTGRTVVSAAGKRLLSAPGGAATAPLDYLHDIVVEPGSYSLRFGVVDSSGRRGGVVREVNAWKLAGEEFALGDLLVGEFAGGATQSVRPGVEPHVRDSLGALIELHATSTASLDGSTVSIEIADDADAPALVAGPATLVPGPIPASRLARAVVSAELLPPGRYVARARVARDGKVAGVLVRPFVLEAPPAVAAPAPLRGLTLGGIARFDPASVLARDTVAGMLDAVEAGSPSIKEAIADARAGRYAAAALQAFNAGDQNAAAFLKGLDWYAKGQLDQAATQLQIAAGPRREFFPAAFYLGASLAAAGRDRDAAGVWQLALGSQARPALAYIVLADARLRAGQPGSAIDILAPVFQRTATDDEIARRLAAAYLMTARYADAIPVLDAYLSRRPADQDALFAAVVAQYQISARDRLTLPDADKAKLAGYVRAYNGPQQALLQKYLETLRRN